LPWAKVGARHWRWEHSRAVWRTAKPFQFG
jgi:hypothetical protein